MITYNILGNLNKITVHSVEVKMCEWVEESDSEGTYLKTKKYEGKLYVSIIPGNIKDHLESLQQLEVREDDTFILSYPKSGTHWVFTIASMLRTGKSAYIGSPHFLDYNDVDYLNKLPSPRLLASHMTFDRLPRQVREGKGKVFVVSRNPKDVAVSLYTFLMKLKTKDFSGSWEGFLRFYMEGKIVYGSWFDTLFDWEKIKTTYKGDNIMYLVYEEMKQDLLSEINKMATFLGVEYDKSFLEEVTERNQFKTMVKTIIEEIKPQDQQFIHKVSDEKKLPIYRKGEVGDWKNHFTVAQNEAFDRLYQEQMRDCRCTFRFD